MGESTGWSHNLVVTGDGKNLVSHAGTAALRLLADKIGLTGRLNAALARRGFLPVHPRGRVLADIATVIADGGEKIGAIDVLGQGEQLFGPVASVPTAWRTLNEIGEREQGRIAKAVAASRHRAWEQIKARHGALPGVKIADRVLNGVTCIRIDATLVTAHSEKEHAAPTWKQGFGFHPLLAYCDNTAEPLAGVLRSGKAGSNTAADHLAVLDAAIAAVPAPQRRHLLVTCDGAGASHDLIDHLDTLNRRRGRRVWYLIGFDCDERVREAITCMPESIWQVVIDHAGQIRIGTDDDGHDEEKAQVAEITCLLRSRGQIDGWPDDMRLIVRQERPHPGAQLSLFEHRDGWRYQIFCTNIPPRVPNFLRNLAYLDAAARAHARVEDRIRTGKDTGIGKFPSASFAINSAWLVAALLAATLLAWFALLTLDGPLAKAEPKTLRYQLLHVAARLTHGQRNRYLKIDETWPWAADLVSAFHRIQALPAGP